MEDTEELELEGLQGKKLEDVGCQKIGTSSRGDNLGNLGVIRPGGVISPERVYSGHQEDNPGY